MNNIFILLQLIVMVVFEFVNAIGPFLLWGNEKNLEKLKSHHHKYQSTLSEIDKNHLISIYSNVELILLFEKRNSIKLNSNNFQCLNELLIKNHTNWVYLPQNDLPVDALDYNNNIEITNLDGVDIENDDRFICETYFNRIQNFGDENVLGILSNNLDMEYDFNERSKFKRSTRIHNKQKQSQFVLYKDFNENILFYTSSAPVLMLLNDDSYTNIVLDNSTLIEFEGVIENGKGNLFNFTIFFTQNENQNISLRFLFNTSFGYWSVTSVDIETDSYSNTFHLIGDDKPIAPYGFSYSCYKDVIFMDENDHKLTLKNIQVEPILWRNEYHNETRFDDAYDCVGFITVPILAGLFVSFLCILVTLIGIIAIMEIKTPTRFDSNKTKQLTIILNEQDVRN